MPTNLSDLYKEQISLTEWFARASHKNSDKLRQEDNDKQKRLEILYQTIGLPYDRSHRFPAEDLANRSKSLVEFLAEHGNELCALRLVPRSPELPKLRMRGLTIAKAMDWFAEQQVDPAQYDAFFVPHTETTQWASIFVVTDSGIVGEFISGGHHQLTQGFYDTGEPVTFYFNFKDFTFNGPTTPELEAHIREVVSRLLVPDEDKRTSLAESLLAEFVHEYLKGYFESVCSEDFGLWFIDYNRLLGDSVEFVLPPTQVKEADIGVQQEIVLQGSPGSPGIARGKVKIVPFDSVSGTSILEDEILVCAMTSPHYLPLMAQCAGIITEQGGILSHAAIVCRELGKPCIVGTKSATEVLADGMEILVDADTGRVYRV